VSDLPLSDLLIFVIVFCTFTAAFNRRDHNDRTP